jgi:cell wall-associated NlpC family hydrolase
VDGTTIWARLDGVVGDKVILHSNGRTYRVEKSRLASKSIDKLDRILENQPIPQKVGTNPESYGRSNSTNNSSKVVVTPREIATQTPAIRISAEKYSPMATPDTGLSGRKSLPSGEIMVRNQSTDPAEPDPLPLSLATGNKPAPTHAPSHPPKPQGIAPSTPKHPDIRLEGKRAVGSNHLPRAVHTAIDAGNKLQRKAYKWGGGREQLEDTGYDCSGAVSYVLIKAGLLKSPLSSTGFTKYGTAGPGRWVTVYAKKGHVFIKICGLRLDTGDTYETAGREKGPRWRDYFRSSDGYVVRHPKGF